MNVEQRKRSNQAQLAPGLVKYHSGEKYNIIFGPNEDEAARFWGKVRCIC
jgi:hypothetical protein